MKIPSRFRGVAAVELAVLMVPLVVMAFGMIELGRAFYYYNSLVKSAREASRYLAMYNRNEVNAQARCLAVHGNTACNGEPLVPGLTTDMVNIAYTLAVPAKVYPGGPAYGSLDMVTVTIVGFPFLPYTGFPIQALDFGPIASTMRQGAS